MHPSFHGPLLLAGGTDGPEGSLLVLLSEAIFIISVATIYRRRRYPLLRDSEPTANPNLPPPQMPVNMPAEPDGFNPPSET